MFSEPRTISLLTELIHLPMKHAIGTLREVYTRVCTTCGYENFIRVGNGARIERQDGESSGFSHLSFGGDRIQLTEDHAGVSVEQFAAKVLAVLGEAVPRLRIPVILVQQVTVRVICAPNNLKSAAEYLERSIFQIRNEDLELLGRPTNVHGFRLVFPATREQPSSFNTRVESYLRDPRSVYIENVGTYKTPIQIQSLEPIAANIRETADFLSQHLVPFLSRYDRRNES